MNFYWLNVFDHLLDLSPIGLFSLEEAMNKKRPPIACKRKLLSDYMGSG
jgi:hypothetical protein